VDDITGDFFFLEMNTRLQVEHGITELCYDVDLVALMLRQADYEKAGIHGLPTAELLAMQKDGPDGAAIEVRVFAEHPHRDFAPSPGLMQSVQWPEGEGVRVDTWVKTGQRIAPYFGMHVLFLASSVLLLIFLYRSIVGKSHDIREEPKRGNREDA
jgi:acetyl/propionyl-CoA carboxylase alpha subunit